MIKDALRYFFPKRRIQTKLPPKPLGYGGNHSAYGEPPPEAMPSIRLMLAAGIRRTPQECWRLLCEYKGVSTLEIIKAERRKRRHVSRLQIFAMRLWKFLISCMIVALLSLPIAAHAQDEPIGRATVITTALNVRAEPHPNATRVGVLRRGAVVTVYEQREGWLRLQCRNTRPCWINGSPRYVRLEITLPQGELPTSESQANTMPVAVPQRPDIVLASYTVTPAVPRPDQPFTITLTFANIGAADAEPFSIGALLPDGRFAFMTLNGIPRGGQGTVEVVTRQALTGRHTLELIIDIEEQLAEADRSNNIARVRYQVDRPFAAQSILRLEPFVSVDLHGGIADLSYDGVTLQAINGAQIETLYDVRLTDLHYDMLAEIEGEVVTPAVGMIIAVKTAEERRGWLRIAALSPLEMQFAIYSDQ